MSSNPTTSNAAKNPISLRLYKVLSTNFEDHATREALDTLSELYGPTSSADNPGEHAVKARRSLRRDMENKLAESSHSFVVALGEVDQKLSLLQAHIAAMHTACEEAENQLKSTNDASKTVLERAGSLRDERQEVEDKKSIINLLLSRFTLTDDETEAITSREVPVGPTFFQAMDKTERIREDCRVLMAGEEGPTRAGLDIMSSTSTNLEQGYDKILRFLSNEFRRTGKDYSMEVTPVMRESVVRLKKRQELLTESLTILSDTRQQSLLTSFLTALTRGGPSGLPRPIELHAHDPLRYVGDMLAWVHQAIAAEREFLEGLFGVGVEGGMRRMVGSARDFSKGDETEEEDWVRELMDLGVAKLCVPLKNRVLQTVRSQESSIVSYKITNLLQFYLTTMGRTVGPEALLTKTLKEITEASYAVFETSIEAQSRSIGQVPLDLDDASLTPPLFILDHAQVLKEVMSVYHSSIMDDEERHRGPVDDGLNVSVTPFEKVLDLAIDPVIKSMVERGEEKARLRPRWDGKVYVINCLTYILSILDGFPSFTSPKQDGIKRILKQRVNELIEEHFMNLLREAGLLDVYTTMLNPPTTEPLSRFPQTSAVSLRRALHTFSLFLESSSSIISSPRLSFLTSASVSYLTPRSEASPAQEKSSESLAQYIHKKGLGRLTKAYETICENVRKAGSGYEAGETLVGSERPFGRGDLVRAVFGIKEDEGDESQSDEEEDSEEDEEESGEEESEDETEDESAQERAP